MKFDDIKCSFCPEVRGVLKEMNHDKFPWAHVSCINWIPELYFHGDEVVLDKYDKKERS